MARMNLLKGHLRIALMHDVQRVNLVCGSPRVNLEHSGERLELMAGSPRVNLEGGDFVLVGDATPGLISWTWYAATPTPFSCSVTTDAVLDYPTYPTAGYARVEFRFTQTSSGLTFQTGWSRPRINEHEVTKSLGASYINKTFDKCEYRIQIVGGDVVVDWTEMADCSRKIPDYGDPPIET